ncbi:tRNA 5-methoxyuridine(34)/uridine 5-oxyacetic acid(34) synthase CmoB [Nitratifractor sp.]
MTELESLRRERRKWLGWKNIAPLQEAIDTLPEPGVDGVELGEVVTARLEPDYEAEHGAQIEGVARMLMPWRKGPFRLGELLIDSEWRSQIKYDLLEPHFDLEDKVVGDIGCNNGYYLFRMQSHRPARLIGFDPSPLYYSQFRFLNRFFRSPIEYELLGVEHLPLFGQSFDTLFCLGVLYHRSDPVGTLKALRKGLKKGGELFLDTFMIEGDGPLCLTPGKTYSKIPNIYFIPTVKALENWCEKAGFSAMKVLTTRRTDRNEQRKTEWIETQSLEDFLDPEDPTRTVEGYPAPLRLYVRIDN